jgi:hypothetical protein
MNPYDVIYSCVLVYTSGGSIVNIRQFTPEDLTLNIKVATPHLIYQADTMDAINLFIANNNLVPR